jgi:hypothetical protein
MAPKTVKPAGRGAPAPKATPAKKTAKKKSSKKTSAVKSQSSASHYIRNLHNAAGGSRIDLGDGRRIILEPRGQVGDVAVVTEDDANDPIYQRNVGVLFEELTPEQGREVIDKQNTNAQAPRPTIMDQLTNEYGEKYVQTQATIAPSFESQGITVAKVEDAADGRFTEQNTQLTRTAMGPEEVQVPGSRGFFDPNQVPPGLNVEQAKIYIETPPEQRLDLLTRWGLTPSLGVRVQPTERE